MISINIYFRLWSRSRCGMYRANRSKNVIYVSHQNRSLGLLRHFLSAKEKIIETDLMLPEMYGTH